MALYKVNSNTADLTLVAGLPSAATSGYFQSTCVPVKKNDSVVVGGSSALSNVNGSIRLCPAKVTALEV